MEQVHITITCDEGYAADFLRQLANEIEECETLDTTFETYHGIAEVEAED